LEPGGLHDGDAVEELGAAAAGVAQHGGVLAHAGPVKAGGPGCAVAPLALQLVPELQHGDVFGQEVELGALDGNAALPQPCRQALDAAQLAGLGL